MKTYYRFTKYTPQPAPEGVPSDVLFIRDAEGVDWYDARDTFSCATHKVMFDTDSGVVVSVSQDAHVMWPLGFSIAEIATLPTDFNLADGWVFDGVGVIPRTDTADEIIAAATREKAQRSAAADSKIIQLERAVRLGMATDSEKDQLMSWEIYSVMLNRVDTSTACDIEWPAEPE